MWQTARDLDVSHLKTGSLVVGRREQLPALRKLKERGDVNGVVTEILSRAEMLAIEPNVADCAEYALFAPEAGVISPYQLVIGYADRAVTNGAEIILNSAVTGIIKERDGCFRVMCGAAEYTADVVINDAGGLAAEING
jgi:glycerol-3-phosphate dehydrogenase